MLRPVIRVDVPHLPRAPREGQHHRAPSISPTMIHRSLTRSRWRALSSTAHADSSACWIWSVFVRGA
jgi:hypothetical protein